MNIQDLCRCTFVLLVFPTSVFAAVTESAVCERGDITRHVELRVEGPSGVPCNVTYLQFDQTDVEQRLWSAQNDASYCVEKYQAFLVKLKNKLNWSCTPHGGEPPKVPENNTSSRPESSSRTAIVDPLDDPAILPEATLVPEATIEAETILAPEPTLEAASPVFPTDTQLASRSEVGINVPEQAPKKTPLNFDTVRSSIPSGYYTQASNPRHEGDESACPADGYFLWNSQDPDRPVFEMGPILEFAMRIDNVSIVDQMRTDTVLADISSINTLADANRLIKSTAQNQSQSINNCLTSVHYSYCQGLGIRQGEGHWQTNDASFNCDTNASDQTGAKMPFALFQNSIISDVVDSDCAAGQSISHMALRPVVAENASESSSFIELVVVRTDRGANPQQRRAICRYSRN